MKYIMQCAVATMHYVLHVLNTEWLLNPSALILMNLETDANTLTFQLFKA